MKRELQTIHPGMSVKVTDRDITVLRLHYDADPNKACTGQPRVHVPDINMDLGPWAYDQYKKAPSPSLYLQELEVKFDATLGELVYYLHEEATLEKSFPVPEDWTRTFLLDPHPGVPHAALWGAVDRFGEPWIYRELWPSKVYGKPGNIPSDDNRTGIRDYMEVCKWLESDDNPHNQIGGRGFQERIMRRVVDYAAKAFGRTKNDEEDRMSYYTLFEQAMQELGMQQPYFENCIKNGDAGVDAVNEWLKPRQVHDGITDWQSKSRIHIFADRCPELVYELKNNRREQLTAVQAEKHDPTGKPIAKRNHLTDLLKYYIASNPQYIEPTVPASDWKPMHEGISY